MIHPLMLADIERMVAEKLQENTTLDFKRQLPDAGKNDDLARAIAALANTAGGTLIYGIEEDDDNRAKSLAPFPLAGTAERIALVAGTIDEPITPLSIYTVEESDALGYVVVELALSSRAPHFYKGVAHSRTPKTTAPLTRRQVGELFARSDGFVDEFRLQKTKPGRLLVKGRRVDGDALVSFSNDGESDITEVDWTNYQTCGLIIQIMFGWPFPVTTLRPGQEVTHSAATALGTGPFTIQARWRGSDGQLHEEGWAVTF
jgi:hypothetical protein